MTFYQLVTLARVRTNNQNFMAWPLISAAVAYDLADKEACRRIPIFFGQPVPTRLFMKRPDPLAIFLGSMTPSG
jgi:hypothetical protein